MKSGLLLLVNFPIINNLNIFYNLIAHHRNDNKIALMNMF